MNGVIIDTTRLDALIRKISATEKVLRSLHDGVPHGIYQEMGTINSPPRPFMIPAAEAIRQPMIDGLNLNTIGDIEAYVDKVAQDALAIAQSLVPVDKGDLLASLDVSKVD